MLKSMTAYGRASVNSEMGRLSVELQSVNRKHLEINMLLPKEFARFDGEVRKWIGVLVGRGQVTIKVRMTFEGLGPVVVSPNFSLAGQIKEAWEKLAGEFGLPLTPDALLGLLSQQEDILLYDEDLHDEEKYRLVLKEGIDQALQKFVEMKLTEGKALHHDIVGRFALLRKWIDEIALRAPGATSRYREKLKERLDEALGASIENEDRILREVCVYADRIDITEELTRFNSHLKQIGSLLEGESKGSEGIGKTLEFIVQELNREINTISSKSSDIEVSRFVISIKSELERIREQIQNIE